ncbi:MAG: hypothetical protein M3P98_00505 [bacterium]|nr:hypothetical protein [bacterium]
MIPLILVISIVAFPLVLGLAFRVKATHIFFSVMAGELIARYFGESGELALKAMTNSDDVYSYGEAVLLMLPIILTALFLKGTLSRSKTILHALPLTITGVVFAAFLIPILPLSAQDFLGQSEVGKQIINLNGAIIGTVIVIQLLDLWFVNADEKHSKRGRKKKHRLFK